MNVLSAYLKTQLTPKETFGTALSDTIVAESLQELLKLSLLKKGITLLTHLDGSVVTIIDVNQELKQNPYTALKLKEDFPSQVPNSVAIKSLTTKPMLGMRYRMHLLTLVDNTPVDFLEEIERGLSGQIGIYERHDTLNHKIVRALDSIEEAITFCDKDGYLLYANKKCGEILGDSRENQTGRRIDHLTDIKPILIQVLESKTKIIDAEYFMKYHQKTFHLTTSAYPVFENDEIVGAIDIFQEIERTRKLASSIAGYRAFFTFDHIIGHSEVMRKTKDMAQIFSKYNENILITGESGTGKELFAQSIHNHSTRKEKPFIAINCANFPNDLIDSELFGYEEGAFTGAVKGGKPGKFEVADGGTLFLDEIGEMQFHLQAKLLRVLETMTISRIGSTEPIRVDVRIIAATNRKLESLVEEGKFRKDLYYRLKVLYLEIPSLKDRREDIPFLAQHFIEGTVQRSGKKVIGLTPAAQSMLLAHDWAGNVRELENTMSRSVYICEGEWITEETLISAGLTDQASEPVFARKNVVLSKDLIAETFDATGGNKKRTAEILSISRPTLYKLLKEYNIIKK